MVKVKKKTLTTAFGIHVSDDQNSMTAGKRVPLLMQDVHLLEKLSHLTLTPMMTSNRTEIFTVR